MPKRTVKLGGQNLASFQIGKESKEIGKEIRK